MGVVSPPVKKQKEKRRRSTDSTVSEEADTERRKHAAVSTVVPRSYRGSAPRAARPSSGDSTEDEADSNDRDRDSEASTIHEDEVQASQASLTASAMLRMDNSRSVDLAASPPSQQQQPRSYHYAGQPQPEVKERGGDQQQLQFGQHQQSHTRTALPVGTVQGAAQKGRILQSKIFGAVSKAGVQRDDKLGEDGKRKRLPTDEEVRAKRLRTAAQEELGLGISGV